MRGFWFDSSQAGLMKQVGPSMCLHRESQNTHQQLGDWDWSQRVEEQQKQWRLWRTKARKHPMGTYINWAHSVRFTWEQGTADSRGSGIDNKACRDG